MNRSRTPRRHRKHAPLAAAAVAAALVAACSSPATDDTTGPAAEQTSEASADSQPPPSTAADTAVDADGREDTGDGSPPTAESSDTGDTDAPSGPATLAPISVAVMYPDVSVAAEFGFAEPIGDLAAVFQALADAANEAGGIGGHPIDLNMVQFDLIVDGDSVRACLTATQDIAADIVIGVGGVFGDPVVCVAEQNETLLITTDGSPDEFYARADGRLFTLVPSKGDTQLATLSAFADTLGAAPFAVFSEVNSGGDADTMQDVLLPALSAAGLEPAVTVLVDSDAQVAASQIPIEVEALRAAGVETIISTTGFFSTAAFAAALEAGGVDVTWVGSDAGGFASDLFASQMDPNQLDSARAVTVRDTGWEGAGLAEPQARETCRVRAGDALGTEIAIDSIDVAGAEEACNYIDLLVSAGEFLDGEPTTESLAAALRQVTQIEFAGFGPAGFGDSRQAATTEVREITWSADCGCWSVVGEYAPLDVG
ncbi:MAG: hypothetical protein AAGA42_12520 [Actinomycetota bacterium]